MAVDERFNSLDFHRDVFNVHRALATLHFEAVTGDGAFVAKLLFSDDDKSILIAKVAEAGVDETLSFPFFDVGEGIDFDLAHGGEEEAV